MQELEKPGKKEDLFPSFEEMVRVFSALANQDALRIFAAARDGIGSSTKTIRELGLTQKRYYTRLNELIKAGLIEKNEETYQHTMLGKLCYKLGEVFDKALGQRDRLDLLDKLKRAKTLTPEETKTIAQSIAISGAPGLSDMGSLISSVRMIENYEKFVQDAIELIQKAEDNVYFASQYFDVRVIEPLLKSIQSGVKYSILYSKQLFLEQFHMVTRMLMSSPSMLKFFIQYLKSPDMQGRLIELPFTFIIVDNKHALIEVAKPFTKAFSVAFVLESEKVCQQLIEIFDSLWRKSADLSSLIGTLMKRKG